MVSKGTNSVHSIKLSRCNIQISLLEDDFEDLSLSNSDDSSLDGNDDSQ